MTVDQGPDMERYQGIVPLHGDDLTEAAHGYFEQSEQIPTRIRMAAGPLIQRGSRGRELAGRRHDGAASAARGRHQARCPCHSGDAPEGTEERRRKTTTG